LSILHAEWRRLATHVLVFNAMKAAMLFLTLMAVSCSRSDEERARERTRQTTEQVKRDSKEALRKLEAEGREANREVSRGLDKTRDKVRGALDQPDKRDRDKDDRR
jgi:hypothetical protein